jgi:hypothetical protein
MNTKICGAKTKDGTPCRNPITSNSSACAAGHPHTPSLSLSPHIQTFVSGDEYSREEVDALLARDDLFEIEGLAEWLKARVERRDERFRYVPSSLAKNPAV